MYKMIRLTGRYKDLEKIELPSGKIIGWRQISDEPPPQIPFNSEIEITLAFEERDYLAGNEGIVWATYDKRQAKIIRNALLSQKIVCEIRSEYLQNSKLHLLTIPEGKDIETAIDFIWREDSGLQLKPDWEYPAGKENESFNRWINDL